MIKKGYENMNESKNVTTSVQLAFRSMSERQIRQQVRFRD